MEIRPELDNNGGVPLYRQLGTYLQEQIESGNLHPGDRLPPTRELAGQLGLNRNTVAAAYDVLESEGLIKAEVGRGSSVSGPVSPLPDPIDWSRVVTPGSSAAFPGTPPPGLIH